MFGHLETPQVHGEGGRCLTTELPLMRRFYPPPRSPNSTTMKKLSLTLTLAIGILHSAPRTPGADNPAASPASRQPTLFLTGDSTVKNGSGNGAGGLWGWGHPLAAGFDPAKLNVANRALGGRSSRTFQTEGLWDKVLAAVQPGDFVMMQFGHNDGGPLNTGRARASLKGTGEESQEVTMPTGKKEVVHTYGWYLRKYIADIKARGATPIVLSPIPRNMWRDGKVARAANDYGQWAAEAAQAGGAFFIDLNELVAKRYEAAGAQQVQTQYFTAADHTHTTLAGAQLNATCVIEGLQGLKGCSLAGYVSPAAGELSKPAAETGK
jgi:rhamnogalacturonan acetylesterase